MFTPDTLSHIFLGTLAGICIAAVFVLLFKNRLGRRRYEQLCFDQQILDDALKDSESRFQLFYETAFEGIAISKDAVFLDCNKQLAAMIGYSREELIGKKIISIVPQADRDWAQKKILAGYAKPYEARIVHKNGSIRQIEVHGLPAEYKGQTVRITVVRDLTRQKEVEAQLAKVTALEHQATKMEAIGTFAAGIAHDLNNALSPIIGHAGVMLMEASEIDKKSLHSILKGAELAAKLVHQIQSFAKTNGQTALIPTDLGHVVNECVAFLRSAIPATVNLTLNLDPDLMTVMATETTIKQILMNLCKNSAQALPANGGTIVISVKNYSSTESYFEIPAGSYVKLEVEDNGAGMDAKTVEQALVPYFTTKDPAENSGIGLSVVRGIVESYKSFMHLYSEPGVGTRVSIFIPATSSRQATAGAAPAAAAAPVVVPMGHGEHILFCDDERYMCDVVGQVLASLNYRVVTYHTSQAALDDFLRRPQKYAVVISDATMPKPTGIQFLQHVKQVNRDVKTILCSGLGSNCKSETALAADDIDAFITKPASREVFATILNEILTAKK